MTHFIISIINLNSKKKFSQARQGNSLPAPATTIFNGLLGRADVRKLADKDAASMKLTVSSIGGLG